MKPNIVASRNLFKLFHLNNYIWTQHNKIYYSLFHAYIDLII